MVQNLSFLFTLRKRGGNNYLHVCFQQSVKGSRPVRVWRSLESKLTGVSARHWNRNKQRFNNYIHSNANNRILLEIETRCNNYITMSTNKTLRELVDFYDSNRDYSERNGGMSIESFLLDVIREEQENSSGCNFEIYYKLLKRLREFDPELDTHTFKGVDTAYCDQFAKWIIKERQGASYKNLTKSFKATFNRAVKAGLCSKSQIIDVNFNSYKISKPLSNKVESTSQQALTVTQTYKFLNLDLSKYIKSEKDRVEIPFMYDLVSFMLFTFVAPCDLNELEIRHIENNQLVFVRKKLLAHQKNVELPISKSARQIIEKYQGEEQNYIFPLRTKLKIKDSIKTRDYVIKKSREKMNKFLKLIQHDIGCNFDLTNYVFRRTAISLGIASNIPVSYITDWAGTSIMIAERHYINTRILDADSDTTNFVLDKLGFTQLFKLRYNNK